MNLLSKPWPSVSMPLSLVACLGVAHKLFVELWELIILDRIVWFLLFYDSGGTCASPTRAVWTDIEEIACPLLIPVWALLVGSRLDV